MTQISDAMKAAGIKTPTHTQRIWNWLRDNPNHSCAQMSKVLNINQASIATAVRDMVTRGMVVGTKTRMKIHRRNAASITKNVGVFTVEPSMRGVYELLPKKINKNATKMVASTTAPIPAPQAVALKTEFAKTDFNVEEFVNALSVPKAIALRKHLNALFV